MGVMMSTTEEKLKLGEKILNFKIPFRKDLLYEENITFGFEIEYCYAKTSQVCDELFEKGFNWEHHYEPTVRELDKFERSRGGEVVSPIIRGSDPKWDDLKQICELIKFCLGEVNEKTAGHIHLGTQIFTSIDNHLNNFLFLWEAFEDIIKKFFYGEFIEGDFFKKYAPLYQEEFKKANYDYWTLKKKRASLNRETKYYGVNFNNFRDLQERKDNTIEIRAICGTLEPEIWQNNLNFLINFIKWCDNITKEELVFIKNNYNLKDNKLFAFDKALFLADNIFSQDIDKMCFLKQYFKDFYIENPSLQRVKLIDR